MKFKWKVALKSLLIVIGLIYIVLKIHQINMVIDYLDKDFCTLRKEFHDYTELY